MNDDFNFQILVEISQELKKVYSEDNQRRDGPFAWIRQGPRSRQVGKFGEEIVKGWLSRRGFNVSSCGDRDADLIIEGKRAEIKFSTLWEDGEYRFQQIRDQNYDMVVCLGLSESAGHCWAIPKDELMAHWENVRRKDGKKDGIKSQHGGQRGVDTAWIAVRPDNPPEWLKGYGGSLEGAITQLRKITGVKDSGEE